MGGLSWQIPGASRTAKRVVPEDYPNAMRVGRRTVSIPLSAGLSDEDVEDVIDAVHKSLGR